LTTKRFYRVFAIVWLLVVAVLSLIPVPKGVNMVSDKTIHFFFYLITSMIVYLSISNEKFVRSLSITVISVLFYGIFLEVLQSLVPYRTFSIYDIIANTLGIVTYIVFYVVYHITRTRYSTSLHGRGDKDTKKET